MNNYDDEIMSDEIFILLSINHGYEMNFKRTKRNLIRLLTKLLCKMTWVRIKHVVYDNEDCNLRNFLLQPEMCNM